MIKIFYVLLAVLLFTPINAYGRTLTVDDKAALVKVLMTYKEVKPTILIIFPKDCDECFDYAKILESTIGLTPGWGSIIADYPLPFKKGTTGIYLGAQDIVNLAPCAQTLQAALIAGNIKPLGWVIWRSKMPVDILAPNVIAIYVLPE